MKSPGTRSATSVLALVVATIGIFYFLSSRPPNLNFEPNTAGVEISFTVLEGESGAAVAHGLVLAGVVKTWQAFFNIAAADARSRKIQPGSRVVNKHVTGAVALEQLLDTKRLQGVVVIPEGARASQVASILISQGFDAKEVGAALRSAKPPFGTKSVEGFLFPATYAFPLGTSAAQAVKSMLAKSEVEFAREQLSSKAATLGFTPLEIITIASLCQAEGNTGDFRKISRVVYNRLQDGMRLQFDSTVLYALKTLGRIRVTNKDLTVVSRYNTYAHAGLPPGPIGNPGLLAIQAALSPTTGKWLYFITVKPGDTRFTASEREFYKWKVEYQKNYAAGAFKESSS